MQPIFFVPFFEDKPWGGNRLAELYGKYPSGIRIAESWELSAVQYRQTCVRAGLYVGYTLKDLYRAEPGLFGTKTPYFPLVIKLLDVTGRVPISVHGGGVKSDADQTDGAYVIEAGPEAWLKSGTRLSGTFELFRAMADGAVEDSAYEIPVKAGDSFLTPPGVPHAIGGGQVVYQIASPLRESTLIGDMETPSDRELEKAFEAFRFGVSLAPEIPTETAPGITRLLETELFSLEKIDAVEPVEQTCGSVFTAYTALSRGALQTGDRAYTYNGGDTFVIPAGGESYRLVGGVLLKATPR
ncbi:mannose-6-phosphate isomerase [Clostridia bacterium]|nr:mannose-6-phosphate isomerase [Clostridia bacterium]